MTSAELITTIKKQPIGFACGAICLICAVLLYVRSDKISESQAELDAKSGESARILANVSNSKNLPEHVAEIQVLAKELDGRLIRAGQLAVNLQYFYKLEADTGIKLLDVHQNNPPKGARAKSLFIGVPYSLSIQGSYKQVLTFLHRLEDGSRFCHFSSVSFNKSSGSSVAGAGAENMTLSLNIELLGLP